MVLVLSVGKRDRQRRGPLALGPPFPLSTGQASYSTSLAQWREVYFFKRRRILSHFEFPHRSHAQLKVFGNRKSKAWFAERKRFTFFAVANYCIKPKNAINHHPWMVEQREHEAINPRSELVPYPDHTSGPMAYHKMTFHSSLQNPHRESVLETRTPHFLTAHKYEGRRMSVKGSVKRRKRRLAWHQWWRGGTSVIASLISSPETGYVLVARSLILSFSCIRPNRQLRNTSPYLML